MPKPSVFARDRALKPQEAISQAMAEKITWCQAAQIIEVSDRSIRRRRQRRDGSEQWHRRHLLSERNRRIPESAMEPVGGSTSQGKQPRPAMTYFFASPVANPCSLTSAFSSIPS